MSNTLAIKVEHIQKRFKLPVSKGKTLRRLLFDRLKGQKGYVVQEVLKDVNFEIEKGDFFGIVGRNGSGKSTLLKIITEIYTPDAGRVMVDGEVVSFIELGVGFNQALTGRENVYLACALFGFDNKEVDAMYDDIVSFAELHDFMDQKLELYSSGMRVRLAFSVAIQVHGDILILDEVLAVGDQAFREKCHEYFMSRKTSGQTTILVTHNMESVLTYCNKALFLEDGRVALQGSPEEVAKLYSERVRPKKAVQKKRFY